MNIESAQHGQTLAQAVPRLTPVQAQAYAKLQRISEATSLVALTGGKGVGKTVVLETFQARHGGHLIRREEILRVISTVPPERTDSAIAAHFELLLAQHDLVLFDDFTDLMESGGTFYSVLGYRSFYFTRFLVPLMHASVLRAGKRLIMAGRMLTREGGSAPDPVELLYGSSQVALVDILEPGMDDYAAVVENVLGMSRAASIDFKRVHDYASHLNCYQLGTASRLLSDVEVPTAAQFIAGLRDHFIHANTRTEEVEALSFDSLPGSEEIASKLETHVVLPLENLELADQLDLKPKRGVLLYGPPGTGKTSIGRALAHRMKGKFFLIDGSVLTDWPGTFFYKFKSIIEEAKANAPSVVFIDDADVLFTIPHIAGLPRYLLSLLDGVESETAGKVCVMMTAMDASKIPEALLRSGRVELWLETRLPAAPVRADILKRWMVDDLPESESVDYLALAEATDGRTPADLRRLVADAKTLYAADRVRGRLQTTATEYLRRAIEQIATTRKRMDACLNDPPPASGAENQAQVEPVTAAEFETAVLQSRIPILVDFWASWCDPCEMIATMLDELALKYAGQLKIVKLNCEENPHIANSYQVHSIPRLMIFRGGEVLADQAGVLGMPAIEEMIRSVLSNDGEPRQRMAKYGLGIGGMAETGTGCKVSG